MSRLLGGATQLIGTHPGDGLRVQGADRRELVSADVRSLDHLLEELPDDTTVSWQNSDTNIKYQFRVHQSFELSVGDRCRAFTLSRWDDERFSQAFRTACRDRAGQWSLIFGD